MGDSITAYWPLPYNNLGVAGNHASEMLARFPSQVLGQGYSRVVILAGTDDFWFPIAGSDQAIQQIAEMAQMASAAGIEVVLCELPPLAPGNGIDYTTYVLAFNASLQQLAALNGYLLVDYYDPMVGHPEYFVDGVHPNQTGYYYMTIALSSVVQQ
jgi:lysophospholipase L1-like esterase